MKQATQNRTEQNREQNVLEHKCPGLKQRNIHEQKNPSMKSQFWNLQTHSRVGISPKVDPSHLP